jgi:hypothetical protein
MTYNGICQCGCGRATPMSTRTHLKYGIRKGEPTRFATGHYVRENMLRGPLHPSYKTGRRVTNKGYVQVLLPGHCRADARGYVLEHVLIAGGALGKPIPSSCPVHHVNEIRSDNTKENLVVCNGAAYHKLLHRRMRAQRACGNPNWRKCSYCQEWDDPAVLSRVHTSQPYHKSCAARFRRTHDWGRRFLCAGEATQ